MENSMRPVVLTLAYLAFVLGGAAVAAPQLYYGVQTLAESWPILNGLADKPFHRYLNRCMLALALAGLWPFLKGLGATSWRAAGLQNPRKHAGEWRAGIVLGFVTLAAAACLAVLSQARTWNFDHTTAEFARHFKNAAGAALVVGLIEEVLFRGGLFAAVRRFHPFGFAAALSSGIYALVHFFAKPANPEVVTSFSGFEVLGQMFSGFTHFDTMCPGFLNLALVGWMLAFVFEKTGAIYLSYGLHAGFIFWVKSYNFVTVELPGANIWFWGGSKLVDGWVSSMLLFLLAALLYWRYNLREKVSENAVSQPASVGSDRPVMG